MFYLEKQRLLSLKKIFKLSSISKQKSFVYWCNFPEGFDIPIEKILSPGCSTRKVFAPFSWQEPGGSLDSSYVPIYMRYVHIASYKIDISNNETDSLANFLFTPCKERKYKWLIPKAQTFAHD